MDYTLAIDQGTHASRALLLDEQGHTLASHMLDVGLKRPRTGQAEQDGDRIHASVTTAIESVLHTLPAGKRERVSACGLTTQRSSVMAWQAGGAARSSLLSWQDTRGAPQTERLSVHRAEIRKISGLPLSPHYGASKLHWLHQLLDDAPGLCLGPLASFLLERLTGQPGTGTDHTNAQRMQLFDIRHRDWSRQLCDWFEVPLHLLPACKPVADDYGLLKPFDIPITAVCGDQNAAWFASGRPAATTAHINIGSGAFVLTATMDGNGPDSLLTSIAFSDASTCEYLIEGTVNGAGSALQWLQLQRGLADDSFTLGDWLEQVNNPPLFMNTVGGLGSPWWQHAAEPRFVPDSDKHTDAERAVAVAESIIFLLQYNLEQIQARQAILDLRLSGGLSRIPALCQKLSNLSDLPVTRSGNTEASAHGVAWLAAGQPAHWLADDAPLQHYRPRADNALKTRYHAFIEALGNHLRTSNG